MYVLNRFSGFFWIVIIGSKRNSECFCISRIELGPGIAGRKMSSCLVSLDVFFPAVSGSCTSHPNLVPRMLSHANDSTSNLRNCRNYLKFILTQGLMLFWSRKIFSEILISIAECPTCSAWAWNRMEPNCTKPVSDCTGLLNAISLQFRR
jgi:hypothetical protein